MKVVCRQGERCEEKSCEMNRIIGLNPLEDRYAGFQNVAFKFLPVALRQADQHTDHSIPKTLVTPLSSILYISTILQQWPYNRQQPFAFAEWPCGMNAMRRRQAVCECAICEVNFEWFRGTEESGEVKGRKRGRARYSRD
ncbi:hypothetical protein HZH66_007896 [Vespula vulgaris]|uniref:Uncharacterized protein n=1 Tax=Vespula vulgaris TaxID=7454 RepID=A0A834JW06_VESVU|nr:hypothetical protein HZH66_007896 [Vespula vulgaris]